MTVILFSEFNLIIVRHKGYRLCVRRILRTRIAIISRNGRYDWINSINSSRSMGHPRQLFFSGRHNPRGWCFTMQTALFSSTGVYRCYANNTIKQRANRVPFPFFIGRTWPYRPRFYRDEKLRSATRSIPTLASRWLLRSRQCLQKNRIRCVLPAVHLFLLYRTFFPHPSPLFFLPLSLFFYIFSRSLPCSLCRLCLTSKRRTIKYWESSGIKGVSDQCVSDWGFRMYNTLEIGIKFWIYVFDYSRYSDGFESEVRVNYLIDY